MNIRVIKQVAALPQMKVMDLKAMWKEYFEDAPASNNKSYLVKQLAYRIQELAEGGLSDETGQRLAQLAGRQDEQIPRIMHVNQRPKDPPIAGAQLVREWKGVEHIVSVQSDGYEYQGRKYKSLSAVAREITGTRWNGRIFFGLKKQGKSI